MYKRQEASDAGRYPNAADKGVEELSGQLSSQIEYNNNLIHQLQMMERKQLEATRMMSEKDQQLRRLNQELSVIKEEFETVREESFQQQLLQETHVREINSLKSQLDTLQRERNILQSDNEVLSRKLDQTQQQLKWQQEKQKEELSTMQSEIGDLHQTLQNLQHEKSSILAQFAEARDKYEKTIAAMEHDMQSQHASFEEHAQHSRMEIENLMRANQQARNEIEDMSNQHAKALTIMQQNVKGSQTMLHELREQYNFLQSELRAVSTVTQTLYNQENSQTEAMFRDFKLLLDEKNKIHEEFEKLQDKIQSTDVLLEEERAKTIMFEEKVSKLEQGNRELQRKAETADRRAAEMNQARIDSLRQEVAEASNNIQQLQKELSAVRQQSHNAQMSARESQERERGLHNQISSMTDNFKKLQVQLGETQNLLKTVQEQRGILSQENDQLKEELNNILRRTKTTGLGASGGASRSKAMGTPQSPQPSSLNGDRMPVSGLSATLPPARPSLGPFTSMDYHSNGAYSTSSSAGGSSFVSRQAPSRPMSGGSNSPRGNMNGAEETATGNSGDQQQSDAAASRNRHLEDKFKSLQNFNQRLKQNLASQPNNNSVSPTAQSQPTTTAN